MNISPKYQMQLIQNIESTLWDLYDVSKYKNILYYIQKWQVTFGTDNWNNEECNFYIKYKDNNIDLRETLHGIKDLDLLLKIATDLEIEPPGFIPVITNVKSSLETSYSTAYASFEKAIKLIEVDPNQSIGLANATLESIIKHILDDNRIASKLNKNDTLKKLTESILKEFSLFPGGNMPEEIKQIGSGLISASIGVETLRSAKTFVHGHTGTDHLVNESIYSYFIVNSISTIGLFLIHFYESKYSIKQSNEINQGLTNESISIEDIPF